MSRTTKQWALILVAVGSALPAWAAAQPPRIPVQGFLADAVGTAVDGPTEITFRLYDSLDAAVAIFEETQTVAVEDGSFAAQLGSVTALDLTLFQGVDDPHLGIQIGSDAELTPRLPIGSVGYAAVAAYCGAATTLDGQSATDFAESAHGHSFAELTDVPADLLDGDADTTYSGADFATSGQSCSSGTVANGISPAGDLQCTTDQIGITGVTAGTGLSGGGTSGAVTIDFAGVPQAMVESFDMQVENFSAITTRTLTPAANSFCSLSLVRFGDDNDEDDTSLCQVLIVGDNWVLQGRTNSNEAIGSCGASCLVW